MAIQNIINSLLTSNQAPLDAKISAKTRAELQDLGDFDYKAFVYYEDMKVSVIENHTTYIWREEEIVGETGGLLSISFTYPANSISNGIDYSGRIFNFFVYTKPISEIEGLQGTLDTIEANRQTDLTSANDKRIEENNKISGTDEIDLSILATTIKNNIISAINENKNRIDLNQSSINSLSSGIQYSIPQTGNTSTNEPAPTVDGIYPVNTIGTFTNFGNLNIASLDNKKIEISVEQNQTVFKVLESVIGLNLTSVVDENNLIDAVNGKAVSDEIKQLNLTDFTTGENVVGGFGSQNGTVYLSLQAELTNYDKVEIGTNVVSGLNFVQYRESGGVFTLIDSIEVLNGEANISNFTFEVGDYLGTLILGNSANKGVAFIVGGNTTRYIGGQSTIPTTINDGDLLTSALTFDLKLTKNSIIKDKITENNSDYYNKIEIDVKLTDFITGQVVDSSVYGNQSGSIYLSERAEKTKYNKAEVVSNYTGVLNFLQYREDNGVFTLINSAPFIGTEVDLSGFTFEIGDWIGHLIIGSNGVEFLTSGGTTRNIGSQTSIPATINDGDLGSTSFQFSLKLITDSEITPEIVKQIEINNANYYDKNQVDSLTNSKYKKVGNIVYSNFRNSNIPTNWVNSGFTSNINGLQSPINGSINTIIEYDQYSNLDSFVTLFKFNMIAPSEVLLTNYHKKNTTLGGHVIGFDMINGIIKLYAGTVKGTLPTTVLKQETIPFTIKNGDTTVRYERNADQEIITLVNADNSYSFSYDGRTISTTTGQGYDKFGLVFLSGDIIVQEGQYSCQLPSEPDLLILGDSIVNGDTIRTELNGGSTNRWAGIVAQKTLTSIASLGGNKVTDIIRDLDFYLGLFKPNKCMFALGVNDSLLSTYTTNAELFITACNNAGIEPILQTLAPRATREQYCEDVSNWVKNRGVRYIDFRKTLTIDGLGVTNIASYFLSDNLHPNALGHLVMGGEVINTLEF